jgi:anti-anti-sigma factor
MIGQMPATTNVRYIDPGVTVVEFSGRMHTGTNLSTIEDALIKMIRTDGVKKLVLDLTNLERIDSAAIGVLVMTVGEMGKSGGQVRICGAKGMVADSFEIVHMSRIAPVDATIDDAVAKL